MRSAANPCDMMALRLMGCVQKETKRRGGAKKQKDKIRRKKEAALYQSAHITPRCHPTRVTHFAYICPARTAPQSNQINGHAPKSNYEKYKMIDREPRALSCLYIFPFSKSKREKEREYNSHQPYVRNIFLFSLRGGSHA
jgi:hypothetical protein